MGKSAIARLGHIVLKAGPASLVLLAGALSGAVHAASAVANASAMVVAPIAVAENDIQRRIQSASGGGHLRTKAAEALTYSIIVRDLSEDSMVGDVFARAATTISVTLAYD